MAIAVGLIAPLLGRLFGSPTIATGLLLVAPGLVLFSVNKTLLAALNALEQLRANAIGQGLRYLLIIFWLAVWVWFGWSGSTLPGLLTASEAILSLVLIPSCIAARSSPAAPARCQQPRAHCGVRRQGAVERRGCRDQHQGRYPVLGVFASQSVVGVYSVAALIFEDWPSSRSCCVQ